MKVFLCGPHGVGKTTLTKAFAEETGFIPILDEIHNFTTNFKHFYERQFDIIEHIKKLFSKDGDSYIYDRHPIDSVIYCKTFHDLNWLTTKEFATLLLLLRTTFGDIQLDNVYIIPPNEEAQIKNIRRRLESEPQRSNLRETDLEYLQTINTNYEKYVMPFVMTITKISLKERVEELKKLVFG